MKKENNGIDLVLFKIIIMPFIIIRTIVSTDGRIIGNRMKGQQMKYGIIDIETIGIRDQKEKCCLNYGDHLQNLAIRRLYHKMGIKESELYELNYNSIGTYDGEYLVLPINQAITHAVHRFFSPKIIPVFLGISRDASVICQEEIDYFKQFEPIGCRDEFTFFALRNGG